MSLPVDVSAESAVRAGLLTRAFAALLGEVVVWDASARLVFASPGALRRLGLPADIDLAGRTCRELPISATLQAALDEGVRAALTTRRALARDLSEHLAFRSLPLADGDGVPWGAVTWLRPVVSVERSAVDEGAALAPWEDGEGLVAAFRDNFELAEFSSSLLDAEGRFRAMNVVGGATMGQDPAALIGRLCDECFTAEVADEYRRRIRQVMRTRRPLVHEDHVALGDREAWYMTLLVPVYDRRGRIIGVQSMSHDITPLRREAARARLDAAIVEASRGVVGREPSAIDGAVVEALGRVAAVLGADAATLLQADEPGAPMLATHRRGGEPDEPIALPVAPLAALIAATREPLLVLHDIGLTGAPAALQGAMAAAPRSLVFVPVQARGVLLGGLLLRWFTRPTHGSPQVLASLPVLADLLLAVLRRKRAEEALRHSEASLRRAQALARIGSYSFDLRGGAAHWSEETLRIAGVTPGSELPTIEECIRRLVHPDDREALRIEVATMLADGGELARELRLIDPDGAHREVQIVAEAQRDADGVVSHVHGTILDVSERRRLEAQLLHAQKMEAIGRLAGGVAHDFNNLLTVILGGTAALQMDLPPGPLAELVAEIDDAGRRATALTRQLLAFSRRQVLVPVELDLGRIVRESLRVLARVIGEHIKLELALADEPLPVVADASQVEQVLLNLVVNAREAMPAGGRLTIRTALLRRSRPDATGPWAQLSVRDTGCGVAPEVKARMFEPFFTTKPRGQGGGLGLSTVHAVVDGLGGRIEVDSAIGIGTEMRVLLPSRRAPTTTTRIAPPRASELRGHETVLVVEDEDGVRNLVKRVLDEQGYRVLTAREPEEALRICDEIAIDLVLTDLVMPGMSGHVLARRLRARKPTRVLFMSGYDPEDAEAGADELLRKPFAPQELIGRVRAALDLPVPTNMS